VALACEAIDEAVVEDGEDNEEEMGGEDAEATRMGEGGEGKRDSTKYL
jgi:hypothetical protein